MANVFNWDRSYKIEFGVPEYVKSAYFIAGIHQLPNSGVLDATTVPSEAKVISNLEIEGHSKRGFNFNLDCKRTVGTAVSKSERSYLELYNLSKDMIDLFNKEGCVVNISCGYGGKVDLIYSGGVKRVDRRNSGVDIIYRITLQESITSIKNTKVSLSYPEEASVADVLRDLVDKFPSMSRGRMSLSEFEDVKVTGGVSLQGRLINNFDTLCNKYGLDYSFYNGKISVRPTQITQGDNDYNNLVPNTYVMSPEVVKSLEPIIDNSYKETGRKDTKRSVVLTTFLIPIKIDQFFTITPEVSKSLAGTYKISIIQNRLQSRGNSWDTIIKGEPL